MPETHSEIPASIKLAVTIGTLAGATFALVNNKEKVLETAEFIFQKGADYCKQKLEEVKESNAHFADAHEDAWFTSENIGRSTGASVYENGHESEDDDDLTTPDASDYYHSDAPDYSDDDHSFQDNKIQHDEFDVQSLD